MNNQNHPFFHKAYSIAIVCHEANRAWCVVNADDTQKSWTEAEEWQRQSAVAGVLFRYDNPNAAEDAQHNAWMKDKLDAGWVYGEKKDADAKTHPCLVPFDQLPLFQQQKDKLFCGVVDALIERERKITLTFGEAVAAAKKGARIARLGWNGVGMYAVIMPGYPDGIEVNEATQKAHNLPAGTKLVYRPYWQLYTAQKDVAMWSPSGSDSLAEDWIVVTYPSQQQ